MFYSYLVDPYFPGVSGLHSSCLSPWNKRSKHICFFKTLFKNIYFLENKASSLILISGVPVSRCIDANFWIELDKCSSNWCIFRRSSLGQRQEIFICSLVTVLPAVLSNMSSRIEKKCKVHRFVRSS